MAKITSYWTVSAFFLMQNLVVFLTEKDYYRSEEDEIATKK